MGRYSHPVLGKGAKALVKEHWMIKRRCDHTASGQLPVTPRYLEALIRLSEARARAELRHVVLRTDVEDVLEIMKAGTDLEEALPTAPMRKGKSRPNALAERLRQHMERQIRSGGAREFRERDLRHHAQASGASDQDFDKALQRLNDEAVLLIKGSGNFEFTGA